VNDKDYVTRSAKTITSFSTYCQSSVADSARSPLRSRSATSRSALRSRSMVSCHARSTDFRPCHKLSSDALSISQIGGPWDIKRTSQGRELRFAERLVSCPRWLGMRPRNFSSLAWSLSLVRVVTPCERTEGVSYRR